MPSSTSPHHSDQTIYHTALSEGTAPYEGSDGKITQVEIQKIDFRRHLHKKRTIALIVSISLTVFIGFISIFSLALFIYKRKTLLSTPILAFFRVSYTAKNIMITNVAIFALFVLASIFIESLIIMGVYGGFLIYENVKLSNLKQDKEEIVHRLLFGYDEGFRRRKDLEIRGAINRKMTYYNCGFSSDELNKMKFFQSVKITDEIEKAHILSKEDFYNFVTKNIIDDLRQKNKTSLYLPNLLTFVNLLIIFGYFEEQEGDLIAKEALKDMLLRGLIVPREDRYPKEANVNVEEFRKKIEKEVKNKESSEDMDGEEIVEKDSSEEENFLDSIFDKLHLQTFHFKWHDDFKDPDKKEKKIKSLEHFMGECKNPNLKVLMDNLS